ncbi:MAG: hypothetical protein JW819_10585 [Candidatus Krumholzibacteriota bacterium]|nr:hypothetical protein [Candidatus Krumholzibacteriota bacterium]
MPERRDYPRAYDRVLRWQLEQLRRRGWAGGLISPHRAMLTLRLRPRHVVGAALVALLLSGGWVLIMNRVSGLWLQIMEFWRGVIGLPGYMTMVHYPVGDHWHLAVPRLICGALPLTTERWWLGVGLAAVLLLASFLLPRRHVPVAYLLRAAAVLQVWSQYFFAAWPGAFPYDITGYVEVMVIAGLFLIGLVPILLGLTYYVFDFSLVRRLAVTFLVMIHLTLLVPMLFLAHAWLIHNLSLLFMPFLFLIFGLPLEVLVFIALYSWAMSWHGDLDRTAAWRSGRRLVAAVPERGVAPPDKEDSHG